MPLYEFVCSGCRHKFEELCSFAKAEEMSCPACGLHAERQLSSFAFKSAGGTFKSSAAGAGSCSHCGSGNCASCGH